MNAEGEKAADVLLGEGVELEDFIYDVTNLLEQALEQQQQLDLYVAQLEEGDGKKEALVQAVKERQNAISQVEEVLGLAHMLRVEGTKKALRG